MKYFLWCLLVFLFLREKQLHGLKSFENIKSTTLLFINCDYFCNKKLIRNKECSATNVRKKVTVQNNFIISKSSFPIFLKKLNHFGNKKKTFLQKLAAEEAIEEAAEDYEKEETENSLDKGNDADIEAEGDEDEDEIYYDLNQENVEKVLNLIRPNLQIDKGDVELVDIKDNNIYLRLLGNCVGCSSSSITISEVIKKTLKKYIRSKNKKEPNVIITNYDEITEENIQKCLDQLKPYFDFIKIEILISNLIVNKENISNSVSLKFQSIEKYQETVKLPSNIRNEITERIKQKFPTLQVNFEN